MPNNSIIAGVLPVVHTPFDDDDRIDLSSLRREVDWAFEQGADGVCVGMVSEALRLTLDERFMLNEQLVEMTAGRGAVVASVGGESARQAIVLAEQAAAAGAGAMMATPPISAALPDEEVERYYQTLAGAVDLPIIVQDASAYVGKPISLDVMAGLLDRYGPDKILFKPEAAPLGPNVSRLRERTGGRAKIFDGSGGVSLVDCFRRGLTGTIPGMDLLEGIVALWKALQSGDEEAIYRLHFPICAMVSLQMQAGLDGFLAIEKYILHKRGIFATAHRRGPVAWRLDDETAAEVDRLLTRYHESLSHRSAAAEP